MYLFFVMEYQSKEAECQPNVGTDYLCAPSPTLHLEWEELPPSCRVPRPWGPSGLRAD